MTVPPSDVLYRNFHELITQIRNDKLPPLRSRKREFTVDIRNDADIVSTFQHNSCTNGRFAILIDDTASHINLFLLCRQTDYRESAEKQAENTKKMRPVTA